MASRESRSQDECIAVLNRSLVVLYHIRFVDRQQVKPERRSSQVEAIGDRYSMDQVYFFDGRIG